ncbi:hypothetical protein BJ138DRAFT_1142840 [Hygrophoropsis aurantiaca]|uniref:Uncharacterized protein n=1 Tax=Hygrophoropsis aurantiaca TaxID=72124 RepID=A0ACB8ANG7_9AGAM|nr:hypothetical protein BJ138DRAFT_1142840 [Hygrophoropsis aurantiaca]
MSAEFPSDEAVEVLMVFVTVLHGIAMTITAFRLWLRTRMGRLWWEDAWAALAFCLDAICAVSTWTLTAPYDRPPFNLSRNAHIISLWLTVFSYTCLLWCARMSIVFSVLRIMPSGRAMRGSAYMVIVLFSMMWMVAVAVKAYVCGADTSWYQDVIIQCPFPKFVDMIEFTTDLISDVILVALPLRLLWHMKLPRNQRIMILSIFSMSILCVFASVLHVVFLLPSAGFMAGMTADIEGAVGLIVCNLLVVVTYFYRVFRGGEDIESTIEPKLVLFRSSSTPATNTLTTVDLEHFTSISIVSSLSTLPSESPSSTLDGSERSSTPPVSDSSSAVVGITT